MAPDYFVARISSLSCCFTQMQTFLSAFLGLRIANDLICGIEVMMMKTMINITMIMMQVFVRYKLSVLNLSCWLLVNR